MNQSLYYEIHVTIDYPTWNVVWDDLKAMALAQGFRMGDLFMLKGGERQQRDVFFTSRSREFADATRKTYDFTRSLKRAGYKVIRYKIEDTVMDSKIVDELGLVSA